MTPEQYAAYGAVPHHNPVIRASDLATENSRYRVLCEGYTLERWTFLVDLDGDEIVKTIFAGDEMIVERKAEFPAEELRPSKRAYPARTDYIFAVLMRQAGAPLSFTRYPD